VRRDVSLAEFNTALSSPLSLSVIGHQAWRNDPPYLEIKAGKSVKVRNRGGRTHTFTEVANFGAGRVPNPNLNRGSRQRRSAQARSTSSLAAGLRSWVSPLGITVFSAASTLGCAP
jgi:hypothetical protein